MTTPALVPTLKDAWKKVATSITSGTFIKKSPETQAYTYVDTGDAAPNAATITSGLGNIFKGALPWSVSVPSDFYIYSYGAAGRVETQI